MSVGLQMRERVWASHECGTPNAREGVGQSRVWDSEVWASHECGTPNLREGVGQSRVCMVVGTPNVRDGVPVGLQMRERVPVTSVGLQI